MNHILKRISPLAIIFVALAGILTFSSAANAQSTSRVQVKAGTNPGLALTANGLRMVADNNNDFAQRWDREAVTSSTFRLVRGGTRSCLRVAAGASTTTSVASIVLGNCNGARAQWKRVGAPGVGDLLVNVETNHALIQRLCFGGSCTSGIVGVPRADAGLFEASDRNFTFELL